MRKTLHTTALHYISPNYLKKKYQILLINQINANYLFHYIKCVTLPPHICFTTSIILTNLLNFIYMSFLFYLCLLFEHKNCVDK